MITRALFGKIRFLLPVYVGGVIVLTAFYFARGPQLQRLESAALFMDGAVQAYQNKQYDSALILLDSAVDALPDAELRAQKPDSAWDDMLTEIELRRVAVWSSSGDFNAAHERLKTMIETGKMNPQQQVQAREHYAQNAYYQAWLERIEGADRAVWEPLAQIAHQQYRYLGENEADVEVYARQTEAAVRLSRMDLEMLKGLPLPEEVKNGQSGGKGRKKMQGNKKGKKPGNQQAKTGNKSDEPGRQGYGKGEVILSGS